MTIASVSQGPWHPAPVNLDQAFVWVADNIYLRFGNNFTIGGTSCVAPLWAAYIALVNEQAAIHSRPPVGFINPLVYSIGNSQDGACYFHDTTVGDNTWSKSPNKFLAEPGYDLCVGWGTPTTDLIYGLLRMDNQCQQSSGVPGAAAGANVPSILPNPASGRCAVSFECPSAGPVHVEVLDVGGRVVRRLLDGSISAGRYSIIWDGRDDAGRDVASGVHLARVSTAAGTRTARVVILR